MLLGEVAVPAAPALAGLIELAVLLFAFAFVWLVRKLIVALLGWIIDVLSHVPLLGRYLGDKLQSAEQAVVHALGVAEHAIDSALGASWHLLARYCEWVWREIRGNAVLALEIASGLYPIVVAIRAAQSLLHHLHLTGTVTSALVKALEKEYTGIEAKVKALERDLSKGIGDDVLPRLKRLEREAARIETVQLPAAEAAQHQAESAISNLYEWAKGKASLLGVGTFSLAVASALTALGLDWLRCSQVGRLGRSVCGLSANLFNDLLALLADVYFVTAICELLPQIEEAYAELGTPLVEAVTDAALALCAHPSTWAADLPVPKLYLPAVQFDGTLHLAA